MFKKKILKLTLFSLIGLSLLQACKKSSNTNSTSDKVTVPIVKGYLYCNVDGSSWGSDAPSKLHRVLFSNGSFAVLYDYYGVEGIIFGDTLNLSAVKVAGTDSSMVQMQISLRPTRIGNYSFGAYSPVKAGTASALYYTKFNPQMTKLGYSGYTTTGSLDITDFSDSLQTVSGKFNFTMVPKNSGNPLTPKTRIVKSGEFTNLKFQ